MSEFTDDLRHIARFDTPRDPRKACLEAAARIEALEAALQGVARVAHQGGLASMSEADALTAIRRLTLPYWDKSAPDDEARAALPHP